MSEIFHRFKFL